MNIQIDEELKTSDILPWLTGDQPTGLAKAKQLAREAGLIEDKPDRDVERLQTWFRQSCSPLLDQLSERWKEEDIEQDKTDIENYYESRAVRYRHNRQVEYLRRGNSNDHGMGLYQWTFEGKSYRSWLGNEPLATPRQIAGKLVARYPGYEVVVLLEGFTTTNCAGASLVGGIGVPKYQAYLTPKLPNVLLTAERLYLDHGRVLDMEDAARIEREFTSGLISRELYADAIAKLCRDAPVDEGFNDYRFGVWEEIDEKTGAIVPFETDDTRDAPADRQDFEFTYWHREENALDDQGRPVVLTKRVRSQIGNYEWEEAERTSDQDNGIDVQVLLGLSTQQIDDTFEVVGDEASIRDFFGALVPKAAPPSKVEALLARGGDDSCVAF